jgi:spermidine/putrescine transport system substrate-binding protein
MQKFLIFSLIATSFLTACARGCVKSSNRAENTPSTARSDDKKVNLFIWGEYTSPTLLAEFETQTGIKVIESNYSSNEELLAKLQAGADGYDLIIPSDYMVAVMRQLDLLAPIDHQNIPNIKNIDQALLNRSYDPDNQWSLPYSWAVTGIVYNKSKITRPITGYSDFYSRDDLNHRMSILDDNREAIASMLKSQGHSANSTSDQELDEAKSKLLLVKKRVREFNSSPSSLLQQGDLLAAQIFSNEALRLSEKNPEFEFILPDDGFTMAIDNMAIPKSSKHKEFALTLINFLLQESVNIRFSTELLAAPVVKNAREKLPESLRNHPAIGRLDLIQLRAEMIRDLGPVTEKYDRIWTEVKATSI